ncbi:hypothetical protein SCHPADRAFT_337581 [Schizopora paradoxa]|uniref:BZIP domain-containing protein n=1 Tax=Schizopora paradoxa TaxID=27342 RepID=A0A0H2RX29_9AGAM|nr:hypothetical protein SCHPADRAFT_337581 [Schizopora paradoxa]
MASPLTQHDPSSSRNTLDAAGDALHQSQSTKDRRRERNRLAAQKHRLRRNERMNQLEQQVLALQQEKSILLARIDEHNGGPGLRSAGDKESTRPKAPPTPPTSAEGSSHSEDADDDDEEDDDDCVSLPPRSAAALLSPHATKRQRLSLEPPLSLLHSHSSSSPSPAPSHRSSASLALPPPLSAPSSAHPLHTPLPSIDDALASHSHHAAYTRRLEDRIVELERWTEDLNGELADALDSHARSADDLHRRARRAQEQLAHAEHQRAHALREADSLREALDVRAEDERHAQQAAQKLREELESTEVTLDLQRVENDRLRDRLARLDDDAAREEKRLFRELREVRASLDRVEGENRQLRDLLHDRDAQLAAATVSREQSQGRARSVDSTGQPGSSSSGSSRKRKHEEAGEEVSKLSSRLSQTENLLASQSRQLQHVQSEAEEREVDRRRLSEQVCYLQNALGKAGAFLTSKGLPLDFLEDSDDE